MDKDTQPTGILDAEGKPILREIATVSRDPWRTYFMGTMRPNDETLLTRGGGRGIWIYDDIERDTHTYAELQKRKMSVIAKDWQVDPASEDPLDVLAAEVVERQFKQLNFDHLSVQLQDATLKGYAVGEIMWAAEDGEIVAKDVKMRDQRRFTFDTDGKLRMLTQTNLIQGEELPENKFIVHRFGAKDDNPFGLGLGTRLFWPVYFKREGITFWLTFADKFGQPTALGKYPTGTNATDQTKLLNALQALAQDTGVIVPSGMEIELIEAQRSGTVDTYDKLIRYMDEQISRCVLGQADSSRSAGGALKAASDNRRDEGNTLYQADSDLLSATIKRDLVRPIVEYNVPGARLPDVWRSFEEQEDLTARVNRDKILFDMGFRPKNASYVDETYGGEWVEKPAPKVVPGAKPFGQPKPEDDPAQDFAEGEERDAADKIAATLSVEARSAIEGLTQPLRDLVMKAKSLEEVRDGALALYAELSIDQLAEQMELALTAAELAGRYEVNQA